MKNLINRLYEPAIIILIYFTFLSTMITSITVYNNAEFEPIDKRYMISKLSSISSVNTCLCECYEYAICFTATYFSVNKTCLLFFAQLRQGYLRLVPSIMNAKVYFFGNRTFGGLRIFQRTNETVYAIWNTTAGGDSLPSISGVTMGTYWSTEPPEAAFDNNITTSYTNHGYCNSHLVAVSTTCGENTGLYLTLQNGRITLVAFYFVTNSNYWERDPLTITIEGSNLNGIVLTLGSSWTLIYNGSTGLNPGLGRSTLGTLQILPDVPIPFASYRLLITSVSGNQTSTSYSEFLLIGY